MFARALGEAIFADRKACGKICFGRFIPFDSADISVLVNVDGKNLSAVLLRGCHKNTLRNLSSQMKTLVKKTKTGQNADFNHQMNVVSIQPTFVVDLFLKIVAFISSDLGMTI